MCQDLADFLFFLCLQFKSYLIFNVIKPFWIATTLNQHIEQAASKMLRVKSSGAGK